MSNIPNYEIIMLPYHSGNNAYTVVVNNIPLNSIKNSIVVYDRTNEKFIIDEKLKEIAEHLPGGIKVLEEVIKEEVIKRIKIE